MPNNLFSFLKADSYEKTQAQVFAGSPLDRLDERRKDKSWLKTELKNPNSRFVIIAGDRALMTIVPSLAVCYLNTTTAQPIIDNGGPWVLLGSDNNHSYFALGLSEEEGKGFSLTTNEKFIELRAIAASAGGDGVSHDHGVKAGEPALLAEARSILGWHISHRYCAKCGAETTIQTAGFMRKCFQETCGTEHFPRTDPVVIMLAIKGDKCLMGRGPTWPERRYSSLAGFMEPGESVEEAVRRELWEEAGIKAGEVRYFASQPWPFPSTLMIGCYAEALNDDIEIRDGELEDARWVTKPEVLAALEVTQENTDQAPLLLPPPLAIAYHLIFNWAKG